MRIAVLGPLQVTRNDSVPVEVPGPRERLLVAVLATAAPASIAESRLVESLALDGVESLRGHVRCLRTLLEPGLPERSSGQYVLHRGVGYALAVARADVDAARFTDLAAHGSAQLAAGDADDAVRLLGMALALWRGEPYEDWPDAPFADAERRRLTALRAAAESDLERARELLARPVATPREAPRPARQAAGRPAAPAAVVLEEAPAPEPPPLPEPAAPIAVPAAAPPEVRSTPARRQSMLLGGLVAAVVVAIVAARLSARSDANAERAAIAAEANHLAALSATEPQLDVSMLLAAQAFRLADTPSTRRALTAALDGHARVERVVPFGGVPQDAVLSAGPTVTYGTGRSIGAWTIGPATLPRMLADLPGEWGAVTVAAPSTVDSMLLLAGVYPRGAPWLRTVSTLDGTSRLLLEGDQVGGRPVDGAVTADGRRLLLVVTEPAGAVHDATRWHIVEVAVADGTPRDTGIGGLAPVPFEWLRADFADDSTSVVLWDDTGKEQATLVQLADGRQTPIPANPRPQQSFGFRALPVGAARLWADGVVTLVDDAGTTVEELAVPQEVVRDIAVSPDGRWAVTAGYGGDLFRWDVDPATGQWSGRERLAGHTGDIAGVEVEPGGRWIVTVSSDHTLIQWDMRADSEAGRETSSPEDRLDTACAIVARDLTHAEWRRYLPDRPWEPTCTDRA